MPSNTPLPAAEFRRLTDDICRVAENHENMDAVQWALRMLEVTGAYRAARAASPRTLEEVLMDHLITVEKSNDTEDRIAAMGAIITHGRTINARRLAGEGGVA